MKSANIVFDFGNHFRFLFFSLFLFFTQFLLVFFGRRWLGRCHLDSVDSHFHLRCEMDFTMSTTFYLSLRNQSKSRKPKEILLLRCIGYSLTLFLTSSYSLANTFFRTDERPNGIWTDGISCDLHSNENGIIWCWRFAAKCWLPKSDRNMCAVSHTKTRIIAAQATSMSSSASTSACVTCSHRAPISNRINTQRQTERTRIVFFILLISRFTIYYINPWH